MTSWPPYCSMPSVWISPAATQIARTPKRDHSFDSDAAIVSRAERAIEECAIIGIPRRGLNPREEHDAASPRDHPSGRDLVREMPGGVDVQPVHGAQSLELDRLGRRGELAAGVVHQDVDGAEALIDRIEEHGDLRGLAHVAGHRQHVPPVRLQLGAHLLQRLGTAPADRDARSRASEFPRGGAADAGAAPVTIATAPAFASAFSGERNPSSIAAVWRSGDVGCRGVLALRQPRAERFSRGGVG